MYKDDGGMRLTYPTLASVIKYPNCAHDALKNEKCKFNFYSSERKIFDDIFHTLGLKQNNLYIRHPLSYLTEAADDICYRIIDMEDARELKIITFNEILDVIKPIKENLNLNNDKLSQNIPERRRAGYIRGVLINYLIEGVFSAFKDNYDDIVSGNCQPIIERCNKYIKDYMENASNIFKQKIMKDPQKTALEVGSYSLYRRLMNIFIPAAHDAKTGIKLGFREQRALDLENVRHTPCYTSFLQRIQAKAR